jgi:hypothetical protein
MAVNASGQPLCRHARPEYQRRTGRTDSECTGWCEWRIAAYTIILPAAVLVAALLIFVPHDQMFAFQGTFQGGP